MTDVIKRLRRRTGSGNWIPELDGLRFIALASVVIFHIAAELATHGSAPVPPQYRVPAFAAINGYRGVPLFFHHQRLHSG